VHLIAEAERLAYADRAQYVADTDFVPVPVKAWSIRAIWPAAPALIGERSMGSAKPGHRRASGGLRAGPLAAAHLHLASGGGG
jgi:gamma-glutamyltranspeptidase